jgi:2-polyprenyl-3-methyl-5-hydroxy-6-metoxy-1,4-benzoquinol methylase
VGKFIEIPGAYLAQIAENSDRIPRLYYAQNYVLRRMFWQRLYRLNWLISRNLKSPRSCLDLGGGSGVFLPTLASAFAKVILVDLETRQAELVQQQYDLTNVEIIPADIATLDFSQSPFDAAVAADVLEHFKDLSVPLKLLHRWIRPGGMLFTSLPTENYVYVFLRKVFKVEKPWDHHHTGYEVESQLGANGFVRVQTSCVPMHFPIFPLFLITAWRRE